MSGRPVKWEKEGQRLAVPLMRFAPEGSVAVVCESIVDGTSRMHSSQRPLYALPQLRLLTCCWVTGGHRSLLPLPTRSTGLWRRYTFCRKNRTMSYPGLFSKHHGLSNGQRGQIHTFYTSHVVRTGPGEALSHRWRMPHTESHLLCPAACPWSSCPRRHHSCTWC